MAERAKSWDEPRRAAGVVWVKGTATSEVYRAAEAAEGGGEVLYDSLEEQETLPIFRHLYDEMDSLKRTRET